MGGSGFPAVNDGRSTSLRKKDGLEAENNLPHSRRSGGTESQTYRMVFGEF